jgi:hypothetical protein
MSEDNQFGMACPECKRGDRLHVSFHGICLLTPDGSEDCGAHEWGDESPCSCRACDWLGLVKDTRG